MPKATKKVTIRKNKNISLKGNVHIQSTFNNTIVTFAGLNGDTIAWSSCGSSGFKGTRKSTSFAAQIAADTASLKAINSGLKSVDIFVKGQGSGRNSAIRAIKLAGFKICSIKDVTPVPHNGCRPPKRRRV